MTAYKLMRLRRDGSLGPLFINTKQIVPLGVWLDAEDHPTPGYARRPGWHVAPTPNAPHLSTKGRVWVQVEVEGVRELPRPACQGGVWWLADRMKAVAILPAWLPVMPQPITQPLLSL